MKILITGATGYLGAYLFNELKDSHIVIGTTRNFSFQNEDIYILDICDALEVDRLIFLSKPDIIIHTAAVSSVSQCEKDSEKAYAVNIQGTRNIVNSANSISAKVIFISSIAAIYPNNVYGKSKLEAENVIKSVQSGYEILRLSMTFGLSPNILAKRPFNKLIKTTLLGKPNEYDNSWKFQPTYIGDVKHIIQGIIKNDFLERELNIVSNEYCTMYSLALSVLPQIDIVPVSTYSNRIIEEDITMDKLKEYNFSTTSYLDMIKILNDNLNSLK